MIEKLVKDYNFYSEIRPLILRIPILKNLIIEFWFCIIRGDSQWDYPVLANFVENWQEKKLNKIIRNVREKADKIKIIKNKIDFKTSACYKTEKFYFKNKIAYLNYHNHSGCLPTMHMQ